MELIVLADYDQVHDAITNARLTDETLLTEAEALALACDAKILPGIFNKHTGEPLLGRSRRKIPKWLRKQLIARDGGCIGCGAHHNICQVHHIRHWQHGGETTLENTCLVCWRCHHIRIHHNGETVTRRPDGRLTLGPPTDTSSADQLDRTGTDHHGEPPLAPPTDAPTADHSSRPPPHDRHRTHRHRTAQPSRPQTHPGKPLDSCHQLSLAPTTSGS